MFFCDMYDCVIILNVNRDTHKRMYICIFKKFPVRKLIIYPN